MLRARLALFVAALAAAAPAARAAEVEPLLPAETEFVVGMNVKQILASDIIKKFALGQIKQFLEGNDNQKMLKKLGLDPLKDIDTVCVGVWGPNPDEASTLGVIHGKFDAAKLFAAAEEAAKEMADKVSIVEEGDYKLVKFVNDDGKPGYAAAADNSTVLVGSEKKVVAAALTASAKKAKPALSKELAALVLKQDEKASMYACGITEGRFKDMPNFNLPLPGVEPEKIKDGLQKMNTAALTVTLGQEVAVNVAMGMKDADAADDFGETVTKMVTLVKTFLPLAGMQFPNATELFKNVADTLKSKAKDKTITLSLKVTAEAIGKAAGKSDD